MKLLSDVRLGVDMDIIKDVDIQVLNELLILIQPASLQNEFNTQLMPEERDIKRAKILRSRLSKE